MTRDVCSVLPLIEALAEFPLELSDYVPKPGIDYRLAWGAVDV